MSPALVTLGGMARHITRNSFLLTVLYIVVILGIFAVQFTRGTSFSHSFGSMLVSGSEEILEDGRAVPLLPVHVVFNGIDIYVDDQNPVRAFTGQNTSIPLQVTSFSRENGRFILECTEAVRITFSTEKAGGTDSLMIQTSFPARYQKITLPYKLTRSARVEHKDSLSLIRSGKQLFSFSFPVDPASHSLVFSRVQPVLSYHTWTPPRALSLPALAALPGAGAEALRRTTEQFAAAALASFRTAIDSGNLTELLVTAYIAEMGRIGMYRTAVESIPDTFRNSTARTWISSPFLNNLVRTWATQIQKEREDRALLSRQIADSNTAVFEYPSLVQYLTDRDSTVLIRDLVRLAQSADISSLSVNHTAGVLEMVMDMELFQDTTGLSLNVLAEACERRLVQSMVRIGDRLYISDDGRTVSSLDTLRAGSVLNRYGSGGRSEWRSAGNLLITSLLDFAPGTASLPSHFVFSGEDDERTGLIARTDRILEPSVLYPLVLRDSTWYPRAKSLAGEAGPGVWVWTAAQSVRADRPASGQLRLRVRFPVNESHYMVVKGIKPFYRIQLYGMDFRTDPRFETYNSSGYVYNEQTETLYLKMRHRSEEEEVLIFLGRDPASPVPTQTANAGTAVTDAGQDQGGLPADAAESAGF